MTDPLVDALAASRDRTFAIVAHLDDRLLESQIDPIMSPLAWDLGHIAAYEDLWLVHRFADEPLLHPELAARYDAFETPRAVRGEIELLDADGAREYLAEVRERTLAAIDARGVDPVVHEMVIRHELQHTETMRQAMRLGGLLAAGDPALQTFNGGAPSEWLDVPAGPATLGAADDVFAYDNERPRHGVELGAFRIARRPITNATWLHFTEGGGYQRREWWSDEGWAWKEDYDIGNCPDAEAGHPDAPVCHVSWFEADAFAARAELGSPPKRSGRRRRPGPKGTSRASDRSGSGPPPGSTATPASSPIRIASTPRSSSARSYRVLRGGSWATDPRVATLSFRNWDLPERRQIFAGLRLATDPEES